MILVVSCLIISASLLISSCFKSVSPNTSEFQITTSAQSVEIVSVASVFGKDNLPPPGPIIKVTLKNVANEPVTSLTATLTIMWDSGTPIVYTFDVTPENPLLSGYTTSASMFPVSIGGYPNADFPLSVSGRFQSGVTFGFSNLVQISQQLTATPPPPGIVQILIHVDSVSIPSGLINPGGPPIKITLTSKALEPIISLTAALTLVGSLRSTPIIFTFEVSPSNPLMPGKHITDTRIAIGGGISGQSYPLEIQGTLQSGKTFSTTQYVDIVPEITVYTGA